LGQWLEILAYLLKHDRINDNTMTVTGRTLGENLEQWTAKYGELTDNQDVIRPLDKPLKKTGHIGMFLTTANKPDIKVYF
jgi:dihydroxy-acid dehydratase